MFAATTLGIEPHAGQLRFLLSDAPTKVLVGGRRSGKSTAVAIEAVYYSVAAWHEQRPYRQIVLAPTLDQARLLLATIARALRASPLGGIIDGEITSPFPELRLSRDGVIFVRSIGDGGRYLRGHTADRAIVDEAAYVPDGIIEEAIGPVLADTGGQLVLASTPAAKGALFHRLYERGTSGDDPSVRAFHMETTANPHVDRTYVEAQRGTLTAEQYESEYGGRFVDSTGAFVAWSHVLGCTGDTSPTAPSSSIVLGYDPAKLHDRSGLVAVDRGPRPMPVVYIADLHGRDYTEQVAEVGRVARLLGASRVVVDATGLGAVVVDLLRREGVAVEAVTLTARTKADVFQGLAVALERRAIVLPHHRDLLDELRWLRAESTPSGVVRYGASGRAHDDLATALALALYGASGIAGARSFVEAGLPPFLTTSRGLDAPFPGGRFDDGPWADWP